ncbi:MAG: DnaA/Hda family protein, partial [Alphaproteobacteria bacterium]|nr:DnaA/Hda family protein [Alphaproteobacteria bacterium]
MKNDPGQFPPDAGRLAPQWARARARLRSEVGEVEYRNWLRQMVLQGIEADVASIALPSRFLRDWVRDHYGDRLKALLLAEWPAMRRLEFRVSVDAGSAEQDAQPEAGLADTLVPPTPRSNGRAPAAAAAAADSEWMAPLDTRLTFDSFVIGKPNEFAHACARRVAEKPSTPGFNPLFLYGGVGLGKTHLMHAIAWDIRARHPGKTVAYMSAEKFMYRFIGALRGGNTLEFKDQLRRVDVLMIDDLQFLLGKDNTQEEFFHTFNALVDAGKQIVVSADKSPNDLSGIEDRLRTRLG